MSNNSQRGLWIAAIVVVILISICLCIALIGVGGLALFGIARADVQSTQIFPVDPLPVISTPEPFATSEPWVAPTQEASFTAAAPQPGAEETLLTLQSAEIPSADPRAQASEFLNIGEIPETGETFLENARIKARAEAGKAGIAKSLGRLVGPSLGSSVDPALSLKFLFGHFHGK